MGKREMGRELTATLPQKRRRMEQFEYDKLSAGQIRILQVTSELKRGGRRSFSARLQSVHVERLPHFIALSYAWPKPGGPSRSLPCNDQHITISTHLYTAFENLCPPDAACSFAIWVDAICIDQHSDAEKSKQVPHMGSIYSLASQVVVWLGSNHLVDEHRHDIEYLSDWVNSTPEDISEYRWMEIRHKPPFPHFQHAVMKAIWSILLSPWFQRLWIVQEVCLGRRVNVLVGGCFLRWTSLRGFFGWSIYGNQISELEDEQELPYTEGYRHGQTISYCMQTHLAYQDENAHNSDYSGLIATLNRLRSQQVLKPIDKVFGLMFLLPEDTRKRIVVDYSQEHHYWRSYVHLTRALIQAVEGMSVLSYALSGSKTPSLPSWCPDWNIPFNVENLAFESLRRDHTLEYGRVRFGDDLRYLHVQGFQIDRIACTVRGCRSALWATNQDCTTWLAWQAKCFSSLKDGLRNDLNAESLSKAHLSNLTFGLWNADDSEGAATPGSPHISESDWPEIYDCYRALVLQLRDITLTDEDFLTLLDKKAYKFWMSLGKKDCSYFFTQRGWVGRGNSEEQPGDIVIRLHGAKIDFIIRSELESDVATLVSEAYISSYTGVGTRKTKPRGLDEWFTIA